MTATQLPASTQLVGRIEYWNEERGFGFIHNSTNPNQERFFHISNLVSGKPQVGAICTYQDGDSKKGKVALNVQVLA